MVEFKIYKKYHLLIRINEFNLFIQHYDDSIDIIESMKNDYMFDGTHLVDLLNYMEDCSLYDRV